MRWFDRIISSISLAILFLSLTTSVPRFGSDSEQVHFLSQEHSFDYATWSVKATWSKIAQATLGSPRYFNQAERLRTVREYLQLMDDIQHVENDIRRIYADPAIVDPRTASEQERARLDDLQKQFQAVAPLAEATLEMQVTEVIYDLGLTLGGQPIPWVLFKITPLPQNLVVSRRDRVEQKTSYLLDPNLTVEQAESVESLVDNKMDVSSLVVPIGGVAFYPTMVMRTTSLGWLSDTIAHEWIHIYLAYQPLGWNYTTTPELRTMNETTASIAGNEIGRMVMERYYPELLHRYDSTRQLAAVESGLIGPGTFPPPFDFRAEMHKTRVQADELLAAGKIEEAEAYLEARRQIFWERGYAIRKLNQAYFAFYGAYADTPGGAAGEDPVGPAVRELRARSASLKDFLDEIGRMDSFDDLKAAIGQAE